MKTADNIQRHPASPEFDLLDLEPDTDTLLADVIAGLSAEHKSLPSKYFYDQRGAELFEQICELDEYYPTRTELQILAQHLPAIADRLGANCTVIEPGSGSGIKTRLLLDALLQPAAYVPIDVARQQLIAYASELALDFPELAVLPVCADFSHPLEWPAEVQAAPNKLIYFPGSTIGNFAPEAAIGLLRHWREGLGEDGALLIGVDLKKDRRVIEAAYNDEQGITAEFNLNLLRRLNRELGADFDLNAFEHYADYDAHTGAVRMWLISKREQQIQINGSSHFDFELDEAICTEHSYKYSIEDFTALASKAGWTSATSWTDAESKFSLHYLKAARD